MQSSEAKIKEWLESARKYLFREGYCFLCGEKLDERHEQSSTGVLHYTCALAYDDIKEEIVKRILSESKIWN